MELEDTNHANSIAIVGLAGCFPGKNETPEELWASICAKEDCISRFSDEELKEHGIPASVVSRPGYVHAAPILQHFDHFDANLFGMTPHEAELMDPQHRLMLECCWSALEHAGYDPRALSSETAVFVGARTDTYLLNLLSNGLIESIGPFNLGLGNDLGFLATRVSHSFNLTGPSCSVQTACSTSLVCVHLACQSLLLGECSMALAGGIAISVPHIAGYQYQEGSVLSPDGYCRPFDAQARGTVFGSGVGVTVLKRLEEALADGDFIHAIILGSAINNDGAQKASFTAPAVEGQARVIREALRNSQVNAESIGYIEAHGTGTLLGDAIEVRALQKALKQDHRNQRIAIGSIKGNVGHLDAAAGITGLIKVVLSLEHRQLAPSLNFVQPNPRIDFEGSGFYVNTDLREWPSNGKPRRAGVSAFGVGGTNAHVIVQEAPERDQSDDGRPWQLLVYSAKTEKAEKEGINQLVASLRERQSHSLPDVAYTLAVGRSRFGFRRALTCQSKREAAERLQFDELTMRSKGEPDVSGVGFLFPWHQTERVEVSRYLYASENVFRQEVDQCAGILRERCGIDIAILLDEESYDLSGRICLAEVAVFTVEYALAQLWISWGVQPKAMLGQGAGEYVAACLAGVMTLEDALHLLAIRGRLIERVTGAMAMFEASEQELNPCLGEDLWLASINGPRQCVVSGRTAAIQKLCDEWRNQGKVATLLKTSYALHSPLMQSVAGEYLEEAKRVRLKPPHRRYISNVSGTWMDRECQKPEYWVEHVMRPARIAEGLGVLSKEENLALLQVGPGQNLITLARDQNPKARVFSSQAEASSDEQEAILKAVGGLWCAGVEISWAGLYGSQRRRRVPLPTYPFQRKRYWIDSKASTTDSSPKETNAGASGTRGKLTDLDQWFWSPSWKMASRAVETDCADQRWIVLEDDLEIGSEFTTFLRARGASAISVRPADKFQRIDTDTYTVGPDSKSDFSVLAGELSKGRSKPTHICYAWGLTPSDASLDSPECFEKFQAVGFYGLIYFASECIKHDWPCSFIVLSNDCVRVESKDRVTAAKAPPIAFCKILPQENPRFAAVFVDINIESARACLHRLFEGLVGEVKSRRESPLVAYRGKYRWIQTFEAKERTPAFSAFREGGRYLITGGMGSIGVLIAQQLARRFRAKIVLTGRTLPGWRDGDGGSHVAMRSEYETVRQDIVSSGGDVLFCRADSANEKEMMPVVSRSFDTFGGLDGIVHAAGVTHGSSLFRLIKETEPNDCAIQAYPKVLGLYTIEKLSRDLNLDFVMAMSSNASILGGLGFLSYAAANIAMDVYVSRSDFDQSSTRWISANWDHWPEQTRKYSGIRTSMDDYAMTSTEALEAFDRACCFADSGQIVVSTGHLPNRLDLWMGHHKEAHERERASGLDDSNRDPRPLISSVYVEPRSKAEAAVASVWAEVLGIDKVGINDDFFELGGHSLMAVELVSRLAEATNVDVSLKVLFEFPTVAQLAGAIFGSLDAA